MVEKKVKFLIVGGHAVAYHGEPRYTKDVNLWVENSVLNSKKIYILLKDFGAPVSSISSEFFTFDDHFLKLGKEPFRVDIICGIQGLEFATSWKKRKIDLMPKAINLKRDNNYLTQLGLGRKKAQ